MLYSIRLAILLPLVMVFGFLGFILSLISPFNPKVMMLISRIIGWFTFKIFNIELEIRGRENIEKNLPCILISNHQSNLDIVIGGLVAPWKTVSLGKKEIRRIPIYGMFYWLSGNILIDRSKKLEAASILDHDVKKALQKGISVWILPEGTRSYDRGLLPFKRGAFRTVINAQVPLVPVVLSPQHSTLNFRKWKSGKVIVEILPALETKNLTLENDRELTKKAHQLFAEKIPLLEKELLS